jgi:hypothetical protein
MTKEGSGASSQYGDEEESEDCRESGAVTASRPDMRYRRRQDNSPTPLQASLQPAPAQRPTRPQDPQTPPRGTSQGFEGDLARAAQVLRDQTRNEYHRRRADAQHDHEQHANVETSSALARVRAGLGHELEADPVLENPYHAMSRPMAPALQRNAAQQLGIPASNPFGPGINGFPPLPPQTTQTIGDNPVSGGLGSSMAAMRYFNREAAQAALERQVARQEASPEPHLPRPRRRVAAPHPAHYQVLAQPSTSQQPAQQSLTPTAPSAQSSSQPQNSDCTSGSPSQRRSEDHKKQDEEDRM